MNADGSNVHSIDGTAECGSGSPFGNAIATTPQWSPDGLKLVYSSWAQLSNPSSGEVMYILNSDGSNKSVLQHYNTSIPPIPDWSPDGTAIAYAYAGPNASNPNLWLINPDGSSARQLTFFSTGSPNSPAWSKDGNFIAFNYMNGIHRISKEGTNEISLTNSSMQGARDPVWSPDSTKIVFAVVTSSTPPYISHIYTMNADGSNPVQLTFGNYNDWGPDW